MKIIVVDLEASGLDFNTCGIWQIGGLVFDDPSNTFLENARLNDTDVTEEGALKVTGMNEEQLRDQTKQTEKDMLSHFFTWFAEQKGVHCLCQNPQFDIGYLWTKAHKYGLTIPFHFRAFDLHSMAQMWWYDRHKTLHATNGLSGLGLPTILQIVGLHDDRGKHNALEDCRLTAEAFSRLVYSKKLLKEYEHIPLPQELLQHTNI